METVEFTSSKDDRLLRRNGMPHRGLGAHRDERVDPSSRVDLLRYQDDRTIEEDARDVLVKDAEGFISNPRSPTCDR